MAFKPYDPVAAHEARMNAQAAADWQRRVPDPQRIPAMPKVSQMIISKFIAHADVEPPVVVTVRTLSLEKVGRDDDSEQRWIMWFNELKKGMRLNVTTLRIFEAAYGDDSDRWIGRRVQLYWDPTVQFGGKLVGGVRVRLSRAAAGVPGAPAVPAGARFDPMTGKPLAAPAAPQPRFDPMTGQPLTGAAPPAAAAPAAEFVDTATGEVVATSGIDPEFDDDIPF
jgi:hypothetical protein